MILKDDFERDRMTSVSIVIPAFNAAATLNATLTSIARQTYQNWEAIIVDDGSSDFTVSKAEEWCDRDARFRLIKGPNRGASFARNQGASYAIGPWLLFLDSDDLILPDHLSKMLAAAAAHPSSDLIHCAGAKLAADGRIGQPEVPPSDSYFRYLAAYNIFCIHACLVRRMTFESARGFDTSLATCEEWDLWQRLARAGISFAAIEDCLAIYRMRANSLSHKAELLLRGGQQVVIRGHSSDPRVENPVPEYAQGMPVSELPVALISRALWSAGLLIGAGEDPSDLLSRAELPSVEGMEINISRPVSVILGGVPMGACGLYEDWSSLWPICKTRIYQAFSIVERLCSALNFADRCMAELEEHLYGFIQISEELKNIKPNAVPGIGKVNFGDLLRLKPIGTMWGYDRGRPIDRLYIESFLDQHRGDIRGRVLEAGDNSYTTRFGGQQVSRSDVLHIDEAAKNATIIADLTRADHIGSDLFDCIILTQTLQFVFDLGAAVRHLYRILKPGGVLLLTVPGISQIGYDCWEESRFWTLTPKALRQLLSQHFSSDLVEISTRGNVLSAISFLHGLSQEDLPTLCDQPDDPHYPVTIMARAVKPRTRGVEETKSFETHQISKSEAFIKNLKTPNCSVMIVVAHPDDELIGAGGHLRFWPNVSIVYVTNGSPRDPRFASEKGYPDPVSYAAARRREAENALSIVGIPAERLIALGFDDQDASFKLAEITRNLLRLFADRRPDIIVTHAYEGGHPDHDATCFAVQSACRIAEMSGSAFSEIVEMSSYFGRDGVRVTSSFIDSSPATVAVNLDEPSYDLKRRMLDCHSSQSELIQTFSLETECFRPAPAYDFRKPPHEGRLFYEYHELNMDAARWQQLAADALVELGLSK